MIQPPTLTPLALLTTAMNRKWADGDIEAATRFARIALPYVHPRIAPRRPDGDDADATPDAAIARNAATLTDAQLELFLTGLPAAVSDDGEGEPDDDEPRAVDPTQA